MTRLLLLAAAVGLVGILSVPLLLSRRFSDADRYKRELAEWHVSWADASSRQARAALFANLERIRPPTASVTGASRHRRYVRAHQLQLLSVDAVEALAARVRGSLGDVGSAFDCETLQQYEPQAGSIAQASGVQLGWVARACALQAAAELNLADVRSDALLDWLKDEIGEIQHGN
ncbi:MAG: hypothetical protein HYY34_03320 [Chloroflexi bacterium]|nr:hypothetical protein [Chloroflexota bacterium]